MKATVDNIVSRPLVSYKNFDRCEWTLNGKRIFVENAVWPRWFLSGKSVHVEYWLKGGQETEALLIEALQAHGLDPAKYHIEHEFYGDGFFPMALTIEDAIAYYNATEGEVA